MIDLTLTIILLIAVCLVGLIRQRTEARSLYRGRLGLDS